jgi:hypothetical protein
MDNNNISYIKADNDFIINQNCIQWIKKMNDCLEVCTKSSGCNIILNDTHKICKLDNPDTYHKINKLFK